jgi:transketolase
MTAILDDKLSMQAVNTIKFLAVDAVEQANSGHPGMPMGAVDAAFVLWTRYLRFDPAQPDWPDRDRFVLSAGHGCMLLYALLHLSGYELSLDDLRNFRQWESLTPGHPEFGHTPGVEATTGPLGQGISNAVGIALGAKMAAARFNGTGDFDPVTHRTFVLASDGDIMEGISGEAGSMAGHLGLGNLIVLYDDNRITIEGSTDLAFSEKVTDRYDAYGWQTQGVDGHDHEALDRALKRAIGDPSRPSLIACRTQIAHGAPTKQGTADSHGAPLGADEVRAAKEAAGWPLEPAFHVPDAVRGFFDAVREQGAAASASWRRSFDQWRGDHPEQAAAWDAIWRDRAPAGIADKLLAAAPDKDAATRAHSGAVLQTAAEAMPSLVGGSADLAPSNKSEIKGASAISAEDYGGRNMHFGVREHAMGALMNGMLYHGAFRPYGATFLVFSDYMRPAIRLAALSGLPAIYVFTHDAIFVGEDGPTHEPIEHAGALRLIPNLHVWRPADGYETALAWGMALERGDGPAALLLTRQKVPAIERSATGPLADPKRGAYLVAGDDNPDAIVAATGSELQLALAAREALAAEGRKLNVVSVPCLELFKEQDAAYRDALFPVGTPTATVEAGSTAPWAELTGRDGLRVGIDRFGASAPAAVLAEKLGMTPENVTDRVRGWLARRAE